MGCLLGCFEHITPVEPKTIVNNFKCVYSDFYIDYYLGTRFDLWD